MKMKNQYRKITSRNKTKQSMDKDREMKMTFLMREIKLLNMMRSKELRSGNNVAENRNSGEKYSHNSRDRNENNFFEKLKRNTTTQHGHRPHGTSCWCCCNDCCLHMVAWKESKEVFWSGAHRHMVSSAHFFILVCNIDSLHNK